MSDRFNLYGAVEPDTARLAKKISESVGCDFAVRDSSYKGGEYYHFQDSSDLEITIERHGRDDDGDLTEPDFSQYTTLVYADNVSEDVEASLRGVEGLELLRSESL
ncbi:hypothetical protein [Streptomyces sp. NPDC002853]